MPFLAKFFIDAFSALFAFFAQYLGKKAVLVGIALTAFLSALTGLYFVFKNFIIVLANTFDSSGPLGHWIVVGFNIVLPDNWDICMTVCLSADLAVFVYRWNMKYVIAPGSGGN